MRRNYVMAAEGGHGLYHDMIGDAEQTRRWENWIRDGGGYETEGGTLSYVTMEEFWKHAPSGGRDYELLSDVRAAGRQIFGDS